MVFCTGLEALDGSDGFGAGAGALDGFDTGSETLAGFDDFAAGFGALDAFDTGSEALAGFDALAAGARAFGAASGAFGGTLSRIFRLAGVVFEAASAASASACAAASLATAAAVALAALAALDAAAAAVAVSVVFGALLAVRSDLLSAPAGASSTLLSVGALLRFEPPGAIVGSEAMSVESRSSKCTEGLRAVRWLQGALECFKIDLYTAKGSAIRKHQGNTGYRAKRARVRLQFEYRWPAARPQPKCGGSELAVTSVKCGAGTGV